MFSNASFNNKEIQDIITKITCEYKKNGNQEYWNIVSV